MVAYRGKHRWVQTFEQIKLNGTADQAPRLREGGVYLITGGLRGLGLVFAEYLARTIKAKLILLGRTPLPAREQWREWLTTHDDQDGTSRKIRSVQELEEIGAEVLTISAESPIWSKCRQRYLKPLPDLALFTASSMPQGSPVEVLFP